MKPACLRCQRFYRPKKNGFRVIEAAPLGAVPPGNKFDDFWKPYKVWRADLWECQGCGHQLVTGWGNRPESERHHFDFADIAAEAEGKINDC